MATQQPKPALVALDALKGELSESELATLADIAKDIKGATDKIVSAARRWMELSPETQQKVVDATAGGFKDFWARLTRVGLGQLHPQLAMGTSHAAKMLAHLPLEQQQYYLEHLIPVAITNDKGRQDEMMMAPESMTQEIKNQVFEFKRPSTVKVRSIAEQRAWLLEQKRKEKAKEERQDGMTRIERAGWTLEGGRIFIKPEKLEKGLTKAEVARMLRDFSL